MWIFDSAILLNDAASALSMTEETYKLTSFAAAGLLLAALADLPYGYYTFLCIVVCVVAAVGAYRLFQTGAGVLGLILAAIAVLFNPLIPVHLDRATWAPIDIVSAVALVFSTRYFSNSREALHHNGNR